MIFCRFINNDNIEKFKMNVLVKELKEKKSIGLVK